MITLILAVVLVVVLLIGRWVRQSRARKLPLPPGPKGLPILGSMFQIGQMDMHKTFDLWSKQYGPIVYCSVLNTNIVVLNNAELVRKAFCSPQYTKIINDKPTSFVGEYFLWNYRDVLFGMYTETVMKTRTVMKKGLQTVDSVAALKEGGIQPLIEGFMKTEGKDFNPKPLIIDSVGNIFGAILTGKLLSTEEVQIFWDFEEATNNVLHPVIEASWHTFPWLRHLPGKFNNLYKETIKRRDDVLDAIYEKQKKTYVPGQIRGLVDVFIELVEEQGASVSPWFTEVEARTSVLDIIGAGLLTLYNGLVSSLLILLNHPKVMKKMYAEIEYQVGTSRLPWLQDQPNMPYCTAVVYECLRYGTHVNVILPHSVNEDWQFEGYHIPKNSMVFGNLWTMHHEESLFQDPWSFRPDRFLDGEGELLPVTHPVRQGFIPFSVGRRQCVGANFGEGRLFLFLTSVVQNFTLLPPEHDVMKSCDPHDYSMRGLVLCPKDFRCRAVPRNRTIAV